MNKFDVLPLMRSFHPYKTDEELFKMVTQLIMDSERPESGDEQNIPKGVYNIQMNAVDANYLTKLIERNPDAWMASVKKILESSREVEEDTEYLPSCEQFPSPHACSEAGSGGKIYYWNQGDGKLDNPDNYFMNPKECDRVEIEKKPNFRGSLREKILAMRFHEPATKDTHTHKSSYEETVFKITSAFENHEKACQEFIQRLISMDDIIKKGDEEC